MIRYNPLMKLLIDHGHKKTDLKALIGIGPTTLAKMSKNEYVSLEIIDRLCQEFHCQPGDIIEYVERPAE